MTSSNSRNVDDSEGRFNERLSAESSDSMQEDGRNGRRFENKASGEKTTVSNDPCHIESDDSFEDGSTEPSVPIDSFLLRDEKGVDPSVNESYVDPNKEVLKTNFHKYNPTISRLAPGDVRDASSSGSTTEALPAFEKIDYANAGGAAPEDWIEPTFDDVVRSSEDGVSVRENDLTRISSPQSVDFPDEDSKKDSGMLQPGSKFGQFTIIRYIGGGGMGRVYEGKDLDLERTVAVKVLPKSRAKDGGTVARFLNEAKSAARLNHENIAQVYLYGNVDGVPYIAFEYVEGVNLRDYVRENGVLNLNEAIDFVLQSANALAHAAAHGVTHRDVKPSNIIVTPHKRIKLIDMGLARLLKPQDDDLTESGVTLGTFDYISPEQARDPRSADVRSDVYSLGCTFYYMLVGAPPFPEGTMLQKLLKHQGDEAPDVRSANPTVPVEVASVVKKMMKKNPEDRYQKPEDLIADLCQVADMVGVRIANRSYSEGKTEKKSDASRRVFGSPAVYASLVFVALMTAYYLHSGGTDLVLPEVRPQVEIAVKNEPVPASNDENAVDKENVASEDNGNNDVKSSNGADNAQQEANSEHIDVRRERIDVVLDEEAIDSLYVKAALTPTFGSIASPTTEEGYDWRRSFLAAGDNVFSSKRLAFGWQARAANGQGDAQSFSNFSDSLGLLERSSGSFVAYAELGAAVEASSSVVRVVDRVGKLPNAFVSLQAALASASAMDSTEVVDGEPKSIRIELKFNDVLSVPAISFDGLKVEIFASNGFTPTLRFEPPETPNGSGGESMFLLNDADVTLRGVAIDFTVPSQDVVSSEEWSIFEGVGSSSLTLNNSILTICNMTGDVFSSPLHSNVAFLRSHSEPLFDDLTRSSAAPSFAVQLRYVFVRGEGALFALERPGARLEAANCGFNVSGPIMYYVEGQKETLANDMARFSLNLDQSLVVSKSSLIRVDSDSIGQVPFEAVLKNSFVRLSDQALVLVQSSAPMDDETFSSYWRVNGLLTMDVVAFCRRRAGRSDAVQDYPLIFDSEACESVKLVGLNADAADRLDAALPHRFSFSDFMNYLLNPVSSSIDVSGAAKTNAGLIEHGFIDVLKDRAL